MIVNNIDILQSWAANVCVERTLVQKRKFLVSGLVGAEYLSFTGTLKTTAYDGAVVLDSREIELDLSGVAALVGAKIGGQLPWFSTGIKF